MSYLNDLKWRLIEKYKDKIIPYVADVIHSYRVEKGDLSYFNHFNYWQRRGFNITANNFYSAIPNVSELRKTVFKKREMFGVEMNLQEQLELLDEIADYKNEYDVFEKLSPKIDAQKDPNYYLGNIAFDGIDALTYYSLIRRIRPKTIIEVGSGWSTKVAARACVVNGGGELISVEPYPQPILEKGFPGLSKVVVSKVEDLKPSFFDKLQNGDILFIDSSHVVKTGADVTYLLLEIVPKLKKGVYVHFHDIFFPFDYPKKWITQEFRFWNEQYLLHAFLAFNNSFTVLLSNYYLYRFYLKKLKRVFPKSPCYDGGSLWIRKIK